MPEGSHLSISNAYGQLLPNASLCQSTRGHKKGTAPMLLHLPPRLLPLPWSSVAVQAVAADCCRGLRHGCIAARWFLAAPWSEEPRGTALPEGMIISI